MICHSKLEVNRYARIFPGSARHFVFIPWGANVDGWREARIDDVYRHDAFRVLSVGRSGRDYPTLARAVAGEPVAATIICDNRETLSGVKETANLRILRTCYGEQYLKQLRCCDAVVIPLIAEDISAGQMVMIQAMAYGKPIIITRTPTVEEYMTDGIEGMMVRRGDPGELRQAIRDLSNDHMRYTRLRRAARDAYETRHSQLAYLKNLIDVIDKSCSHPYWGNHNSDLL